MVVRDWVYLWHASPKTLKLNGDEVHVWRASLNISDPYLQRLKSNLAQDELSRADRYHFQKDRVHFIAARGLLRAILGSYLETEPRRLRFFYNPHGKPGLAREFSGDAIRFNMSHSHGLAVYAVTRNREVGIDLEYVCADLAVQQIAERFFSPREISELLALPPNMQQEGFFNCWTRKEAYIKARGEGLSIPLNQFDVSLTPGEPATLLSTRWDPQEAVRWSIHELKPGSAYVAALAIEGHDLGIKRWQWPETKSAECIEQSASGKEHGA